MNAEPDVFEITVGFRNEEYDADVGDPSRVIGLRTQDLPELQRLFPDARLSTKAGEIGKGASGPGATLVIEMVERITNDGASLLAVGAALVAGIRWLLRAGPRAVDLKDPRTFAAVAAAQLPVLHERLTGSFFGGSLCLTGSAGLGTNESDVWASYFSTDGWVLVLFSSPSGLVLGHVEVPREWDGQAMRSSNEVRDLFEQARRA